MSEGDIEIRLAKLEDMVANLWTEMRTLESELFIAKTELAEIKEEDFTTGTET